MLIIVTWFQINDNMMNPQLISMTHSMFKIKVDLSFYDKISCIFMYRYS